MASPLLDKDLGLFECAEGERDRNEKVSKVQGMPLRGIR